MARRAAAARNVIVQEKSEKIRQMGKFISQSQKSTGKAAASHNFIAQGKKDGSRWTNDGHYPVNLPPRTQKSIQAAAI